MDRYKEYKKNKDDLFWAELRLREDKDLTPERSKLFNEIEKKSELKLDLEESLI